MKNESLISGFIRSSQAFPDNLALFVNDTAYSYKKLVTRVQHVAQKILQLDKRSKQIGIYAYRSVNMYTSILATLMSDRCYVPLSPVFPKKRVQKTIEKADIQIILTDGEHVGNLLELLVELKGCYSVIVLGESDSDLPTMKSISITYINESQLNEANSNEDLLENLEVKDEELAYLLFTSGSTGDPKGVGITHRNAVSMVSSSIKRYDFKPEDSFTQLFDFTFDLSVFDIFVPLTVGGSIYCVPKKEVMLPHNFVNKHRISVWFSVPAVAVFLSKFKLLKPGSLPHLRLSLFCGEALLETTAKDFARAAFHSTIENLYGPTEATVYFTGYTYSSDTKLETKYQGIIPIGKPLPGLQTIIVDQDLKPVANGKEGELCLAGSQLAPGYWNNTPLTNEKFCALNTDIRKKDNRWYRTGDLTRIDANGDLIFIGRIDDQIQIAGYRVELGEIEYILRKESQLEHLVAIGHRPFLNSPYEILVFYSGKPEADLAKICKENLPKYMQVKRFQQVETMPLNSNGKIDKKALISNMEKD
nr:amino acid adenylation domain-containing protein [Pseudodesulfovibrio sp.]